LLNASITGTNFNLRWPLSGAGLSLTVSTGLFAPSGWTPVTSGIQNTGTVYQTSLPVNSRTNRFYRLQSN
jgi:hypothetical protein